MKIQSQLELRAITGRRVRPHLVLDLALAGSLQSDALEGLAAQWPALRAWMTECLESDGRLSLSMPEARCDRMALGERTVQTPQGPEVRPLLTCSALVRGLRLDVQATAGEYLAHLRLVVRVPLSSVHEDTLLGLAARIAEDMPIEVEVTA